MKPTTWTLPKFRALAEALNLGEPFAAGILHALWHLAATFDPEEGSLPTSDPAELTAGWKLNALGLDANDVVEALIQRRWLDRTADGLTVHDWKEHRPAYLAERLRKRAYQRDKAAKKAAKTAANGREKAPTSAAVAPTSAKSTTSTSDSGSTSHSMFPSPRDGHMSHMVTLSEAQVAPQAGAIFRALHYRGPDGRQIWRAAALVCAGKLAEADVMGLASAAGRKKLTNPPAYLYKALARNLQDRGESLEELAKTVRIAPDWPAIYPGD